MWCLFWANSTDGTKVPGWWKLVTDLSRDMPFGTPTAQVFCVERGNCEINGDTLHAGIEWQDELEITGVKWLKRWTLN